MPKMRNRESGHGKNKNPMTLHEAMGLPGKKTHGPPHKVDTVTANIKKGTTKGKSGSARGGVKTEAGYDVKTKVALPTAKGMGKAARTQRKMKAK